jgi:glycosyltransferase involved in cell wall biosynthesis
MSSPRIGIFIIAYNAVNHLIQTISRIPKEVYDNVEEIFVIDDCSKDNSYYAALGYKAAFGIDKLTVHRNVKNHGYGGNQKIGYQYAIDRGLDIVALVHGDGLAESLRAADQKRSGHGIRFAYVETDRCSERGDAALQVRGEPNSHSMPERYDRPKAL